MSLILAANVAWDPYQRISGHGIFSLATATEIPFEFPSTIYAICQLLDLPDGEHTFAIKSQQDELAISTEPQTALAREGVALVILSMVNCKALRAGRFFFEVTVDGESAGAAFGFDLVQSESLTKK